MATWSDPLGDLRIFITDTTGDWLVKDQKVLGDTGGQNRTFFTFNDRLVVSGYQSTASPAMRVFFENAGGRLEIAASGINITDATRGEFQLMLVPSGQTVTATYHYQQYLDSELNNFLTHAAYQVNADAIANVPAGLRLAALKIAAALAFERSGVRWLQRKIEQFGFQESATQYADQKIAYYQNQAARLMEGALELRRAYYDQRMDRGRAPAYGLLKRTPSPYTPRR